MDPQKKQPWKLTSSVYTGPTTPGEVFESRPKSSDYYQLAYRQWVLPVVTNFAYMSIYWIDDDRSSDPDSSALSYEVKKA